MKMNRSTRMNLRFQYSSTGLILAGFLVLIAYATNRYPVSWDMTLSNRHTLAEQSIKAIQGFGEGITATAYVQEKGDLRLQIQTLLEKYQAENRSLQIRFVDPDLDPAAARQADVAMYGTVVFRIGEKTEKVTETSEEAITNALVRLAKGSTKQIGFISGHGEHAIPSESQKSLDKERSAYSKAVTLLKGEGYQIETLNLASVEEISEKMVALVLAGPRTPLLPVEVERLQTWLAKGGRLLLMSDPGTQNGLEEYMGNLGIQFSKGVVIDPVARLFGGGPTTPLVSKYDTDHPITKGMNAATFFPDARALTLNNTAGGEPSTAKVLLSGAERGWVETGDISSGTVSFDPDSDQKGPVLLAVVQEKDKGRLLVVGDSDFASNAYIGFSGNTDLFLNMVRWLAEDESFIAIKAKDVLDSGLTLPQGSGVLLLWGLIGGIPGTLLVSGFVIWRKRKRL